MICPRFRARNHTTLEWPEHFLRRSRRSRFHIDSPVYPFYQSEYFVPSSAVACDFE
jgi:hypothetical protein